METALPLPRGTMDVMVLRALSGGETHGRGISRWIRDTTGGVFDVQDGALYPALRRLEARGLVESWWTVTETGRKARVYSPTATGDRHVRREVGAWSVYAAAMTRLGAGSPDAGS